MPRQTETVGNFYGKQELPLIRESAHLVNENLIGLELEVENYSNRDAFRDMRYWDVITDGSLRNNGREFVLRHPQGGASLNIAINELWRIIQEHGQDLDINTRTSLHVHVDLRTFTLEEVKRFFMLYIIMEKYLYSQAGVGRDKNIYCPATYEAYDANIAGLLGAGSLRQLHSLSQSWEKYTGINLTRCQDLNTVEIRIHNGTLSGSVARRWVNSLLTLVGEAKNPTVTVESSVDELINALSHRPTEAQRRSMVQDIEDGLNNLEYYTTMHRVNKHCTFAVEVEPTPVVPQEPMMASVATVRTKNRGAFRERHGISLESRMAVARLQHYFMSTESNPTDYIWRADMDTFVANAL